MCVALKRETELKQFNKINSRVEPATTVNTIGSQPLLSTADQPLLSTTDHLLWNRNEKINYTSKSVRYSINLLHPLFMLYIKQPDNFSASSTSIF